TSTADTTKSGELTITVEAAVESVAISGETSVERGAKITLTAAITPAEAEQSVTWSIAEGNDYATINSETGEITGVAIGTVVVKATSTKDTTKSATYTVNVVVEAHAHTFASEWSYNSQNHWKVCTYDGCTEHDEEGAHQLDEDKKCTVCGAQFKDAVFELIPSNLDATTYADGQNVGIFTILPTTTIRNRARENYEVYDLDGNKVETGFTATKSVQYNGTNRGIGINAPAPGKLSIYLDNGSSSLAEGDFQTIVLTKPDGTSETISYPAKKLRVLTLNLEQEGTYTITRGSGGTTDIYYAKFEATVPVTPIEKINIADEGTVEYLIGQAFDKSKLQVQLIYTITGMVEPIDVNDAHLTIDSSAFNSAQAGKYAINVTYTDEKGNTFDATYNVSVYDVEALELGFNAIKQGSDGYNGTYENVSVQQFYFVGDTIDLSGMTVKTVFNGGAEKNIVTSGYTTNVATIDMSTPGVKEVVVGWGDSETIVAKFNIYVAEKPTTIVGDTITLSVDAATQAADIGTLNGDSVYRFKTITQALEFLEGLELDENIKKVINLAEGTYAEKVEVKLPNVTIKGGEDATKTIIEWDALYGEFDESGFVHTTDSTATLNVRRAATGFTIEGVTISNKWNSTEYFDQEKGANYNEHRALAMLIQADKVVIDNCRLLGYQDTIEFFTGRQYVTNTYIQGRTDFIFGTNNTTYSYDCEIHSIVSGGYVTAFKGNNKDGTDAVLYGAIFDNCKFTAPADVITANNTAIGRPWGAYAAVAVINSELGGHISTAAATGASSGTRYVTMSNNNPYDANVKFVEYNNTGAGAITEAVRGMRMLTAEEAANYSDLSVIFGTTNGGVTYTSAWDGSKGTQITEKTYRFTADVIPQADLHETGAEGESIFNGDMTVYALDGAKWRAESSKSQAQFNAGCVIKLAVAGEVSITTYGGNYGLPENVKINYINGKAVITIVATASSPITSGCYITVISLDMSKTPEHTHEYGEWVVSAPTQSDEGSATRTCVDCEDATPASQSVTLPVLSEENYTITAGSSEGKSTYTYTDATYGTITFEADSLAGLHVHDYGEWVVTATLESAGTATKTCNGTEGTCDAETVVVDLPALTSEQYVITNNTATLEAAGTGTYTYIDAETGETITFIAATPKLELALITEDYTYTYSGNGDPVSTDEILFTACGNSGGWVKYGGSATITLNVTEGATVKFTRSPYDNAAKVKVNGVEMTAALSEEVSYFVNVGGYVVISADATAYLKVITVEVDPNYEHVHTYGEWSVTATPTESNTGTATRTCVVADCGKENATQEVTLPVLSAENYTITASANEGKATYTYTDGGVTITFEADALADVHTHNYGEWVITAPTAENSGTAVKTCTATGTCEAPTIEVILPALTSDKYVITDNTATLEAAGTGTYTYTDAEYGEISFSAATPMLVLNTIDAPTTVSFGSSGNYKTYVNDTTLYVEGSIRDNGGNNSQINNGTIITLKVAQGGKIAISSYSGYTNYTVKINGVDYNEGAAETGTSWEYTADVDSEIQLISGSNNYFYSITVTFGLTEISTAKTFVSTDGIDSTSEIEFSGVASHNDGAYWNLGKTGTITIKVAAGAKITLSCSYWGTGITINGVTQDISSSTIEYNAAEGGVIVIGCIADAANVSYLQSISVSFE
ncbi:MAG: pectinesterase family protein, partial [Candidatus Coproplasma sp.]